MNSTTTKKYYKYVLIEKIQIQNSTRFEVKQNIHHKMFELFYDKDDNLISERLARTSFNKKGEETYLVYDSDITNEKQSENDFTKAFTNDISEAMDLYLAESYMMDKNKFISAKTPIKCIRLPILIQMVLLLLVVMLYDAKIQVIQTHGKFTTRNQRNNQLNK